MSIFEKATRKKLRISTTRGNATTEDLWDLSLEELDNLAIGLNKKIKSLEAESFLNDVPRADEDLTLSFEIVKHILLTKKEERDSSRLAAKKKAEKARLLEILAKKQDAELDQLSVDELKAKIAEL